MKSATSWLVVGVGLAVMGCDPPKISTPDAGACTVFEGVCLRPNGAPATRVACGDVTESCDPTGNLTPNLSCLGAEAPAAPAGPATVTLRGFVHGSPTATNTRNLSVTIYDAGKLLAGTPIINVMPIAQAANVGYLERFFPDPTQLSVFTVINFPRACDADPKLGCSMPAEGCTCADGLADHPDKGQYCRQNGPSDVGCSTRLRWEAPYSFDNVPTNRQLVVRVTGPNGRPDGLWATALTWNVYISTGDRACAGANDTRCFESSGVYRLDVNALAQTDFTRLPTQAGLSGGVGTGLSGILGEIHDCDDVRVANVVVDVTPSYARFANLANDPLQLTPEFSGFASGRFAALGVPQSAAFTDPLGQRVPQQTARVVAAGSLGENEPLTSFGAIDLFLYPDTMAIVNVNAGRPRPVAAQ